MLEGLFFRGAPGIPAPRCKSSYILTRPQSAEGQCVTVCLWFEPADTAAVAEEITPHFRRRCNSTVVAPGDNSARSTFDGTPAVEHCPPPETSLHPSVHVAGSRSQCVPRRTRPTLRKRRATCLTAVQRRVLEDWPPRAGGTRAGAARDYGRQESMSRLFSLCSSLLLLHSIEGCCR